MNIKKYEEVVNNFKEKINLLKDVDTKDNTSGIYIFYIENLISDNLIPIYVGQSKNIYNRKNKHRSEAKKLFDLSKEIYNRRITLSSGKYVYCKLVSTLKNNNKTLDDVKFKVLEYCDEKDLIEREKYWIEYFEATIYGFNQFEELVESNRISSEILFPSVNSKTDYDDIAVRGRELLLKFKEKIEKFDKSLLKYKYYSVNYSLLLGNYKNFYNLLENFSSKYYKEINVNIDDVLESTYYYLPIATDYFIKNKYIQKESLKIFEIE